MAKHFAPEFANSTLMGHLGDPRRVSARDVELWKQGHSVSERCSLILFLAVASDRSSGGNHRMFVISDEASEHTSLLDIVLGGFHFFVFFLANGSSGGRQENVFVMSGELSGQFVATVSDFLIQNEAGTDIPSLVEPTPLFPILV